MGKLLNIFKVLSDETRIRILIMLYHKKLCVCELCGTLEESQPKISKHLAKLRDVGYVKDERQEQFIFYYLNSGDKVLKGILEGIIANIGEYPELQKDLGKLETAEKFLETAQRASNTFSGKFTEA